tara:strand:- start:1545 stop:2171 length:627 start_codon:yes stop_codon:yes gene_type:complete
MDKLVNLQTFWTPLFKLYETEGIDVSIRKCAEATQTTHTKLIKEYKTKDGLLKEAYFVATLLHFNDMLNRPRYSAGDTSLRKAVLIGQLLRSMARTGYGSFSMQLWAREKLHHIILDGIPRALVHISNNTDMTLQELAQNLFDGGIEEEEVTDEPISATTKVFLRTGLALFMANKGVQLMKVMGMPNASSGELNEIETKVIEEAAKIL